MKCVSLNFAGALCLLCLAACQSEPAISGGESGGRAEGEVLGGTISDDMIALEQLTSQAPLAPRAGPSTAEANVGEPLAAGEAAPSEASSEDSAGE